MEDKIEQIVKKYALKSTNVGVADVAMALGTIMMSIDGHVDESEVRQAIKFGEMLFGSVDEDKIQSYRETANTKTHRPEINLQVSKRLIESVEFELTKQDRLAIFAFLSAIAVADKKVTTEETDLINLVLNKLELEDVLPSSEIDKEIKKYRDSPEEYKNVQDIRTEIQEDEAVDLVGLFGNITDHYANLTKDFMSALLRLRVLGKLNARQHDVLLNGWLTSPLEEKIGLATAARLDPEYLINRLDSSGAAQGENTR